jgi:hypothetical protein
MNTLRITYVDVKFAQNASLSQQTKAGRYLPVTSPCFLLSVAGTETESFVNSSR